MMSDRYQGSHSAKGTPKGQQIGFFINRTHTPLQTRFTKPQTISPHFSSVLTNAEREEHARLASAQLFRFPINQTTEGDKSNKNNQSLIKESSNLLKPGVSEANEHADQYSGKFDREKPKSCVDIKEKDEKVYKTEKMPQTYFGDLMINEPSDTDKLPAPSRHDSLAGYLDSLEKQILVQDVMEEKHPTKVDGNQRKGHFHVSSTEQSHKGAQLSSSPQNYSIKKTGISAPPRSHTDSVCSSCSVEDFANGHSRCSVCDGSSTTSSGRLRTIRSDSGFLDHIDSIIAHDLRLQSVPFSSQDLFVGEDNLSRHVFGHEECDSSSCKCSCFVSQANSTGQHTRNSSGDSSVEKKIKTISLTKDQLVFLLQRVELSRFREIVVDKLADQDRTSKSQRRTIACLIQAVVIMSKRVHIETDKWLKLQADIRQLQMERKVSQRRQARLTVCMCAILCLYLLNIKVVRRRLMSVIRYFGIVETVKKVNRTRKMVADNWRNIPSVLTNFWRIFIFRSKSKLNIEDTVCGKLEQKF